MSESLKGVVGACLTPLHEDGSVNGDALQSEIDFMAPHVDSIAIGGVEASEYRVLDQGQRVELIRLGVELVGDRVPAIAGASAGTVRDVLQWIDLGADCGATHVQVLMPRNAWGGQLTRGELVDFFTRVSDGSALPIVLYHNPLTGSDPDIATLVELSALDRVVAFKESSRDMTKISRLIHEMDLSGNLSYFATMQPMLATLILGGSGATMPPPGTLIASHVRDSLASGDFEGAIAWQRLFAYFPGVWGGYGLANVMKAAARHVGLDIGTARPPVAPLPEHVDAQLGEFIRGCGMLQGSPASPTELHRLAHGA